MSSAGVSLDVEFKDGRKIDNLQMSVYGQHNASNALVAIAIGDFLGINEEKMRKAFSSFNGVKRRFTKVGNYQDAVIIDDYGHHPTEIKTTLQAARNLAGENKVICIFQPHKYSRTRDLFNEFCAAFSDADQIIIADIYSAGQAPIPGATQDDLIAGIKKTGHKNVIKLSDSGDLPALIKPEISAGDIVFFTGAGNITYWASALEEQLKNS